MITKKLNKRLDHRTTRVIIGLFMVLFFFVDTTTVYAAEGDSLKKEGDSLSFDYTGNAETVNIKRDGMYTIQLYGAQGASNIYTGGKGGYVEATIELKRGDTLYFIIGGQNGFNGGGDGSNANGGGASDIRLNGNNLTDRILVAGGGGGASSGGNGGVGGTTTPGTTTLGIGSSYSDKNSGGGGGGYYGGSYGYYFNHSHVSTCYNTCTITNGACEYPGVSSGSGSGKQATCPYTVSHSQCGAGTSTAYRTHTHSDAGGSHKDSSTTTHSYLICALNTELKQSGGGSNYSNSDITTLKTSLSGQRSGNGYAVLSLTEIYFNIDIPPVDTAVFESMDASFTCYSSISSDNGKYVWQVFYNHEYRDIATLVHSDTTSKNVTLYGTNYEVGFDSDKICYLKVKNTSREVNNNTIYRCIVYDEINGTNTLVSNDVKLTVLTNAVTDMSAVYMYDTLEVNNEIKTKDIFAICSYQSGDADVLRNFAGLEIISVDDNNGNKYTFDIPVTSVKAYKTGNLTIGMKFSNEISYVKDGQNIVETRTYYPTFNIKVVDTTKPVISNIDTSLDVYGNHYTAGNDPYLQVRATVIANDNYCETSVYELGTEETEEPKKIDTGILTYSFYRKDLETGYWQMISDNFRTGNFYDIIYAYGNGTYKVYAKDTYGNTSEPYEFNVTGWDNTPPAVTVILTSSSDYSKYADIFADATDGTLGRYNIGQLSTEGAYFLEKVENDTSLKTNVAEIEKWTSENTFHLTKNGLYRVYVRDNFGNMANGTINITNIDTVSPTVSYNITSCGDGKKVLITLKATDSNATNTNSAVSGLRNSIDKNYYNCFEYSSNVELAPFTIENDYVRTYFYAYADLKEDYLISTYDNAGNCTSNAISVDEILEVIRNGSDGEYTIVTGFTCENTDYTTVYPQWTSNGVIITPEIETGTILPTGAYSWDYNSYFGTNNGYWDKNNGTWSSKPTLTVFENGTYTVCVKLADGFICRKSITITNIDTKKPTITATLNNETLTIMVEDADSGLNKLIADGGSLANIHEFTYDGKNSVKEMITLTTNGTYAIYAVDMAGNRSETYSKVVSSISTASKNFYTVNFMTYTGAILESQYVREGEDAEPPKSVIKKGYIFCGWDKSYRNIQSNMEINAVFLEDENQNSTDPEVKYAVTFCNWDGAVLKAQAVAEGKDATPPSDPEREGYSFNGWDKSYANVREDVTTTALFTVGVNDINSDTLKKDTALKTSSSGNALSSKTEEEPIEESAEPDLNYIELSEFADEAKILSLSAYDRNAVVKEEELADEEYITSILDPERVNENAEHTTNTETEEPKSTTAKKAGAVGFLALSGGGTGFYFLNKKYYWLDLPF